MGLETAASGVRVIDLPRLWSGHPGLRGRAPRSARPAPRSFVLVERGAGGRQKDRVALPGDVRGPRHGPLPSFQPVRLGLSRQRPSTVPRRLAFRQDSPRRLPDEGASAAKTPCLSLPPRIRSRSARRVPLERLLRRVHVRALGVVDPPRPARLRDELHPVGRPAKRARPSRIAASGAEQSAAQTARAFDVVGAGRARSPSP